MHQKSEFYIYNASAGSGKTFTLVKHYLKLLFQSQKPLPFKHILALTFTNKAVGEMKERIFKHLIEFADSEILKAPNDMGAVLCDELNMSIESLHTKSKLLLQQIIHNYTAFEVSTIDKFNHRIIRTFAHDLKLSVNFEVELDQKSMLIEAVDGLIAKAGDNDLLTKTLVNFALEKADEDKSYDVSLDFYRIAELLTTENDIPYIKHIEDKTLIDFGTLKTQLIQQKISLEKSIVAVADSFFALIENNNIPINSFTRGSIPKYFEKISKSDFPVSFDTQWQTKIATDALYPQKTDNNIKSVLDGLQPTIAQLFNDSKEKIIVHKFLNAIYKNITPLSVLNAINSELNCLKEVQNKMLISEFNGIIHNEVKNQPTPYIYERLGEKFLHYCIDEFQDTSVLQWENLIPLIDNALSQEKTGEKGSLLLVGDAKQAIYRWRGGKAEQFIDLYNKSINPFQLAANVEQLPINYRSHKTIVDFNNSFFKGLSETALAHPVYVKLYQNSYQKSHSDNDGYVEISFIDPATDEDGNEMYVQQTYAKIQDCIDRKHRLSDICVLVRKNKEAVMVSEYLNLQGIPVVSSESLLLKNSPEVCFVINFITQITNPDNYEAKIEVLEYLANTLKMGDPHPFYKLFLSKSQEAFMKGLSDFGFHINSADFIYLPLYELVELLIKTFKLIKGSNAYLQFLLDEILTFSQKQNAHMSKFLEYFEAKKDILSIASPEGQEAVKVMTVHKAKGLEFEIVIYPFADNDVHKTMGEKVWFPIKTDDFNGFDYAYLNLNSELKDFGDIGEILYNQHRDQQALDGLNVLYVALTRAVGELYVISKLKKGAANYAGYFMGYLESEGLWQEGKLSYSFGAHPCPKNQKKSTTTNLQPEFISTSRNELNLSIVDNASFLWDTNIKNAIEKGNLIHELMSKIKTSEDIETVLEAFESSGSIEPSQIEVLKQTIDSIVFHQQLHHYFHVNNIIYNEKEIITADAKILRPDRIVILPNNEAILIDYKTGSKSDKHKNQLNDYSLALKDIGIEITSKLLIYVNEDVEVIEF